MRDGLGGGVDTSNRGVPYYIEMINDLARALVLEVNTIHASGWTDNPNGSRTGVLFFEDFGLGSIVYTHVDGYEFVPVGPDDPNIASAVYILDRDDPELSRITARNITLSADVIASAFNIAASSEAIGRPANGGKSDQLQRGNNENANRLYDLFRETGITIQGRDIGSFDEYCTTIRFDVGNTLYTAKQAAETARILKHAANNQRTAIAGVSLDEEMVGLVKYNHAYNGAARVITQMDDALDRLINGTGRVGL